MIVAKSRDRNRTKSVTIFIIIILLSLPRNHDATYHSIVFVLGFSVACLRE